MDQSESLRIHQDWWGQCRTCRWWCGKRKSEDMPSTDIKTEGRCTNERSPLGRKLTTWSGDCSEWDSFDVDVALEIMEKNDGS